MEKLVVLLIFLVIIYLLVENKRNENNRKKLNHVIHVNGIRGKSTVTRLIHSGIHNNGFKVFAKTTGTLPMTINTKNKEELILRKGRANIKEQMSIIKEAVEDDAKILAIECMAVNPKLQYTSQHKILKADIGVITNIRLDHTEEMGPTLEEICESISNTIPENGILITSEERFFTNLEAHCKKFGTKIIKAEGKESYEEINFKDNVACALEVCKLLGIKEEDALEGMKNFIPDPYDLRLYKLESGGIFINGLSINDPDSSEIVYKELEKRYSWENKELILLINNRPDRGYRANHMIDLSKRLSPKEILVMGSFTGVLEKRLPEFNTTIIKNISDLSFEKFGDNSIIYAVGNIANDGDKILEKVNREGEIYV